MKSIDIGGTTYGVGELKVRSLRRLVKTFACRLSTLPDDLSFDTLPEWLADAAPDMLSELLGECVRPRIEDVDDLPVTDFGALMEAFLEVNPLPELLGRAKNLWALAGLPSLAPLVGAAGEAYGSLSKRLTTQSETDRSPSPTPGDGPGET